MVGPLILDAEALAGDADGDLFGLDQVAAEAARPAHRNIEAERAVLSAADKAARERERTLRSERADLVAERDRKPGYPPWVDGTARRAAVALRRVHSRSGQRRS